MLNDSRLINNRILNEIVKQNALLSSIHRDFVGQQAHVHQRFLDMRQNALSVLNNAFQNEGSFIGVSELTSPSSSPLTVEKPHLTSDAFSPGVASTDLSPEKSVTIPLQTQSSTSPSHSVGN